MGKKGKRHNVGNSSNGERRSVSRSVLKAVKRDRSKLDKMAFLLDAKTKKKNTTDPVVYNWKIGRMKELKDEV